MKTSLFAAIATTAISTGLATAPAQAFNLVPQVEGEVNVGSVSLCQSNSSCISLPPLISSIVSLVDSTTGSQSRLFVDNLTTTNSYLGGVELGSRDLGTNPIGFYFRPSETAPLPGHSQTIVQGTTKPEEKGQLEVGTFTLSFSETIKALSVDFFDTEKSGQTGVTHINGVAINPIDWVPSGKNDNIYSQGFYNVNSITLKLGYDSYGGSGDGVGFRAHTIPEPGTIMAGLLATGGFSALRKRFKK